MLPAAFLGGSVSNVLRLHHPHHRHHRRAAAIPLLLAATSVSSSSSLSLMVAPAPSLPRHQGSGRLRLRPATSLPLARRSPSTRRNTAKKPRRRRRRDSSPPPSSDDASSKTSAMVGNQDHDHLIFYTCRHTYEGTLMDELTRMESSSFPVVNRDALGGGGRERWGRQLLSVSSPCPGLVRAAYVGSDEDDERDELTCDDDGIHLFRVDDPVYALQVLPAAVEVSAPSISGLARGALSSLDLMVDDDAATDVVDRRGDVVTGGDGGGEATSGGGGDARGAASISAMLRAAPRGSLTVHALVPGMLKGTTNRPKMERRARNVAESATERLRRLYPCARRRAGGKTAAMVGPGGEDDEESRRDDQRPTWILQLLLLGPEELVASLSPVRYLDATPSSTYGCFPSPSPSWPCAIFPAGLANAEEEDEEDDAGAAGGYDDARRGFVLPAADRATNRAPSSAYRKLLEAVSCMGLVPTPGSTVIDLGASPGGWTSALRRMGCNVVAVDRSELDPSLMADPGVTFVRGDAFAYSPPDGDHDERAPPRWMVSDVIAYPERVTELVKGWFGGSRRLADVAIITVKFRGDVPDWDALAVAADAARRRPGGEDGRDCGTTFVRAKHFFNNKNEVTLMIVVAGVDDDRDESSFPWSGSVGFIPRAMFPVAWP